MKAQIAIGILALLLMGCAGGPSKDEILTGFMKSPCGAATTGERMQSFASEREAPNLVVSDAWRNGDFWEVRISYGAGKTIVRFEWRYAPGQGTFPLNDNAKAVSEGCKHES